MWSCPQCKRPFKHHNQWHSCVNVNADSLFENKNDEVKTVYDALLKKISKFGNDIRITASKSSIFAKAPGTFIAFKPIKDHLILEFYLEMEINEFPIEKSLRISKNRVAHKLRVQEPSEINSQLLGWLKRSYELVRK